MDKPQMKSELAISNVNWIHRQIYMDATLDSVEGLGEFGWLNQSDESDQEWMLVVDSRYDFGEVIDYVRSLVDATSDAPGTG